MSKLIRIRCLAMGAIACLIAVAHISEASVATRDVVAETAVDQLISGMPSWRELRNASRNSKSDCTDRLNNISKHSIPTIRQSLIRLSQKHVDDRHWNAVLNSDKGVMVTRFILRVPQRIPAVRGKYGILMPSEPIHCFLVDGVNFASGKISERVEYDALFPFVTDPNGRLAISIPKDFPSQTGPLVIDSVAEFDYVFQKYGIRNEPGRGDRVKSLQ